MAKNKRNTKQNYGAEETSKVATARPRCLAIAREGITDDISFTQSLTAMMSDLIEGSITPSTANAYANLSGKLLKHCELKHKYGSQNPRTVKEKSLLSA